MITEPIPKYGEIRCYIRDPDGYIIEVWTEHQPHVRLTLGPDGMRIQTRMDVLNRRARVHHEARTAQTGTPSTCQGSSTAWNCQNNRAVKITDAHDPIGGELEHAS